MSRSSCVSAQVLSLLLLTGCAATDPCDGQEGTCLAIDVQGSVDLDTLDFDLSGIAKATATRALTELPVQIAVLLPETAQGTLSISAVALKGGVQVGVGMGTAAITNSAHGRTTLVLQHLSNTCQDSIQGYGETDIDCGGRVCLPCHNSRKCILNSDCLSNICTGVSCTPALIMLDSTEPVAPTNGPTTGGITLVIKGQSFLSGLKVLLGGAAANSVTVVSSTQVQAILPTQPGAFGPVDLTVIDPDGAQATAKRAFYYYGTLSFATAQDFPASNLPNSQPESVVMGDVNGDGKPDLAVACIGPGIVSVLLGKGDGTFQPAQNYPTGTAPRSVALGDVNGDGKPDLAVTNEISNSVSVLLGKGNGTFQPAQNFPTGSTPFSVAIGDVNGDGKPDLAIANFGSNDVSVLLGKGDGTFQPAQNFPAGSSPFSVALGDVNGDGKPDLAIANNNGDNVSVLLGKGDGTFQLAQNFSTGTTPVSVAMGDLNGDGKPDLAVVNENSHTVSVLLGKGNGTFQPAQNFSTNRFPYSVVLGDVNGDGKPDLAVANQDSINVSVLLGRGDGTFQTAQTQNLPGGSYPYSIALGDVNGDGKPDLAVANITGNVSILLNTSY